MKVKILVLGLSLLLLPLAARGQVGIFGTPDGSGVEGLAATLVELQKINSIALDAEDNIYISAEKHQRIFRIDTSGILTVYAGTQREGVAVDGGPAREANLWNPHGLAFDRHGNLYFSDQRNHRVRRIDPSGIISTLAVTGANARQNYMLDKISNLPAGLVVDQEDNVYIADPVNHRVLKATSNGQLTTFAGNGKRGFGGDGGPAEKAQLAGPIDVTLDREGNLLIADFGNNRVRKVDPAGTITTIVGSGVTGSSGDGGSALKAQLRNPAGLVVDSLGNLYIADSNNHKVRKVTPNGKISTIAGIGRQGMSGDNGPATAAKLNRPYDLAIGRGGSLFIVDQDNHRIRVIDPSGVISTIAGKDRFEVPLTF